jgi:hypothetical protein
MTKIGDQLCIMTLWLYESVMHILKGMNNKASLSCHKPNKL